MFEHLHNSSYIYSLRCFCYFCYCRPFFSDTFCFLFHLFICRIRYLCRALDEMTKKCLLKWKDISKQRKTQQKRYLPLIWSRLKETTTKKSTKHKTLFSKEFYFLLLMPLLVQLNDSFFSAFVHLYLIRCRGSNVSEWMCKAISFSPKFQCIHNNKMRFTMQITYSNDIFVGSAILKC